MINWKKTESETGLNKSYFDVHPQSNKKVYRICDNCWKKSWIEFRFVTKLCRSCALKGRSLSKTHIDNISKGMIQKHAIKSIVDT